MLRVPFYSAEDIKGAIRGSMQAFEAALPKVQNEQTQHDLKVWRAAMDAVALSLGVEWRDNEPTRD